MTVGHTIHHTSHAYQDWQRINERKRSYTGGAKKLMNRSNTSTRSPLTHSLNDGFDLNGWKYS
jgi:hypothetical protein